VKNDQAVSPVIGVILMVVLVILLAALLLLSIQLPSFEFPPKDPSFIEIRRFYHEDEKGRLNYDSRVTLYHNGTEELDNSKLKAEFYCNGKKLAAVIDTMNGHEFITTHHQGVQTMGGLGCTGITWSPGEKIIIDFSDGTFHPRDQVRVDIFMKTSGVLVSRYTCNA